MTDDTILYAQGLSKEFTLHATGKILPSASQVNISVQRGRLTALVGPSGSGKSSLLKCIYRTYLATEGVINYRMANGNWIDLAIADEHQVLTLRREEISFVTQFLHCLPRMSTLDVVATPLYELGLGRDEGRQAAAEALSRLNLPEHLWDVSPMTFSGGEKQRVNMARGLLRRPRLMLLDEPTASLDSISTQQVAEMIDSAKKDGCGILAIFHDPDLVEQLADSIIALSASH